MEGQLTGQVDLTLGVLLADQSITGTGRGWLDADVASSHFCDNFYVLNRYIGNLIESLRQVQFRSVISFCQNIS